MSGFPRTIFFQRTIISLVFVTLAISIYFVSMWGAAEILVQQPRYLMQQWESGKHKFTVASWQQSVADIRLAIYMNQYNPEYVFDLARLYEWHALQEPIWSQQAKIYRKQSIQYYRRTTQLRPIWAEAWINLAITKTLNQQLDAEVNDAVDSAIRYGSWEYGTHKKIIWLGLATWESLSYDTQQELSLLITQSLINNRLVDFIESTSAKFDWLSQLDLIKVKIDFKTKRL